jgi:hypothetical protein
VRRREKEEEEKQEKGERRRAYQFIALVGSVCLKS